jgi:hypothetical protein
MFANEYGNIGLAALRNSDHLFQEGGLGVLVESEGNGTITEVVQSGGDFVGSDEGGVLERNDGTLVVET